MTEPGADEAYDAARIAFELGRSVREIRLEAGGTIGSVNQQDRARGRQRR
ncbi:hypothetical protein [Lentzea sp. E54]